MTTSTNLGFTYPTVGADDDTWGTVLNALLLIIDAQHGPKFSATNAAGGAQTITTNTLTKVTLGTELYDVGAYFASSKYTPLVAGTYRFFGNATVDGSGGSLVRQYLGVKKNGTTYYPLSDANGLSGTGSSGTMSGFVDIAMNGSTDYVELWVLAVAAGTVTVTGAAQGLAGFAGYFIKT